LQTVAVVSILRGVRLGIRYTLLWDYAQRIPNGCLLGRFILILVGLPCHFCWFMEKILHYFYVVFHILQTSQNVQIGLREDLQGTSHIWLVNDFS
jgi:hypothetical protein